MRRLAVCCVALAVALLVWGDVAQAQGQGGQDQGGARQGRQGRGGGGRGQGRGQRGQFGRGGTMESLVRMEEVRTEIDMTEDQAGQIEEAAGAVERPDIQEFFADFQNMSDEERAEAQAKLAEANAKVEAEIREKVEGILLSPQMARLNQLYVQRLGVNGLTDAWIAGQLELSDDQKSQITAVREQPGDAAGGRGRGRGRGFGRGGRLSEEQEAEMLACLTDDQTAKYEELKGEEFEFPQRGRGGRGGGRGGRGGRGGGGGGGAGGGGGGGGGGF